MNFSDIKQILSNAAKAAGISKYDVYYSKSSDTSEDALGIVVVEHMIDKHQHHGKPAQIVNKVVTRFHNYICFYNH